MNRRVEQFDVAVLGGGPSGSTLASLVRKYHPGLSVVVLEKEVFPREHIGESQLPVVSQILYEMGAWEKVEAANFPIKIGGTYRWGATQDLWDFEFLPIAKFKDEPRPARYGGQRLATAFQVERSLYDKILLDHTQELGADVRQGVQVTSIGVEGDRVTGFELSDGTMIEAKYYCDCSGAAGLLRRRLNIGIWAPSALKCVAMWDYWNNTEWAVEIGVGGTRIQVLSIGVGWIWFIPIGETRTSIGFICPVDYYKEQGKMPEELYAWAVSQEPRVSALINNATRDGTVRSVKDWSYVADRTAGENWFIVGEAAGFADPILSAGMALHQGSARHVAYILGEILGRGDDGQWLKDYYQESLAKRIRQYIRFAEYWYGANVQFSQLRGFTTAIAEESGFTLDAEQAFRWLSLGGLSHEDLIAPGVGGLDLAAVKGVASIFSGSSSFAWEVNKFNVFRLNLAGAEQRTIPLFQGGTIQRVNAFLRESRVLPNAGMFGNVIRALRKHSAITDIVKHFEREQAESLRVGGPWGKGFVLQAMSTLEMMIVEGWVTARHDPTRPRMKFQSEVFDLSGNIHWNIDDTPTGEGTPKAKSAGP